MDAIADAITPVELAMLARYLFDGMTQIEMERQSIEDDAVRTPRRTISFRLHKAKSKLAAKGIFVRFPGKGRRKQASTSSVSPDAIDRLVTHDDEHGTHGTHGKWIDAGKVDRGSG